MYQTNNPPLKGVDHNSAKEGHRTTVRFVSVTTLCCLDTSEKVKQVESKGNKLQFREQQDLLWNIFQDWKIIVVDCVTDRSYREEGIMDVIQLYLS